MVRAERFLRAALERLEPLRGTFVYDAIVRDYLAKTEQEDAGYGRWLAALLPYLAQRGGRGAAPRVLDFGCGSGELTVLMNVLGFEAWGIDVHAEHLKLAQLLAEENGVPGERFVLHEGGPLPFEDKHFDVVTLLVVLEHLSNDVLDRVVFELHRVCRGVVIVQVPNRWQPRDDHTGLLLVPWMPRSLASAWVRLHGARRRYAISKDGSWDVYYRSYNAIRRRFDASGFDVEFLPDELVYPPLDQVPPLYGAGGAPAPAWKRTAGSVLRGAVHALSGGPLPPQAWYPYLHLVMLPRDRGR